MEFFSQNNAIFCRIMIFVIDMEVAANNYQPQDAPEVTHVGMEESSY